MEGRVFPYRLPLGSVASQRSVVAVVAASAIHGIWIFNMDTSNARKITYANTVLLCLNKR